MHILTFFFLLTVFYLCYGLTALPFALSSKDKIAHYQDIGIYFILSIVLQTSALYLCSFLGVTNLKYVSIALLIPPLIHCIFLLKETSRFFLNFIHSVVTSIEFWLIALSIIVIDGFYYQFPFRNIFASMHFLRGAREILDYSFLNPYNTDSYLPIVQSIYSFLAFLTGAKLIYLEWYSALLFLPLHFYIISGLFKELIPHKIGSFSATITFYLFFLHSIPFSNSELSNLAALCLVTLTLRVFKATEVVKQRQTLFEIFTTAIATILAYLAFSKIFPLVFNVFPYRHIAPVIFILAVSTFFTIYSNLVPSKKMLANVVLITALTLVTHRSGLIFVSVIVCMFLMTRLFEMAIKKFTLSVKHIQVLFLLAITGLGLLLVLQYGVALEAIVAKEKYILIQKAIFRLIFPENNFFANINTKDFIQNNFIEIIRVFPPIRLIIVFTFFLISLFKPSCSKDPTNQSIMFVFIVLMLIVTAMFPFGYRLLPLCVIIITYLISKSANSRKIFFDRFFLTFPALSIVFGSYYIYKFNYWTSQNPYLISLKQIPYVIVTLAFILFVLFFKRVKGSNLLVLLIVVLLTSEALYMKVFFFPYSFGITTTQFPITHYNQQTLSLAEELQHKSSISSKNTIILSDPVSMVNYSTFAGFVPAYSVENLNTMTIDNTKLIKKLMNTIIYEGKQSQDRIINELENTHVVTESEFSINARSGEGWKKSKILVIVNAKTIAWLEGKTDIFPRSEKLPEHIKNDLMTKYSAQSTNESDAVYFTINSR